VHAANSLLLLQPLRRERQKDHPLAASRTRA